VRVKMILGQAQIIERRMCEEMCGQLACHGKQEVGRPSIFVVGAVHVIHCTGSRLRKTGRISCGKPFWACDILGLQKW
jgi:hypothetical protein